MKKIIVKINNGKVNIKTEGYSGSSCQAATEGLERRLGIVTSDEATEEMYTETDEFQSEGLG